MYLNGDDDDDGGDGDGGLSVACWCQHWFEYFPNPPINVLSLVENVLAFHDKELLHHFVRHGVTSQVREPFQTIDVYHRQFFSVFVYTCSG